MTVESKAWNWKIVKGINEDKWKSPAQEVYYLINRWHQKRMQNILELWCGIGRYSILFSQDGFTTYGLDLSENAINREKQWSNDCGLNIEFMIDDMINLPYNDEMMDAIFSYYVISHTDSQTSK